MARKKQDCSSTVHDKDVQSKKNNFEGKIQYLSIDELEDFKNHPFKVELNMELFELMQSIEKEGVLVPLFARPNPSGSGYELIAGHRRKAASKWAGLDEVPVIVVDLDDCQSVIVMVDSNLQREHIKPSEKAFAYRMRLEANQPLYPSYLSDTEDIGHGRCGNDSFHSGSGIILSKRGRTV